VPVDLGAHTIVASAPDRRPWSRTVTARLGEVERIVVPEPSPLPSAPDSPLRATSIVVGGTGVAALAAGALLGLHASSVWNDARATCAGGAADQCSGQGVKHGGEAGTFADAATVTLAAGGAALAAGVVLWFLAKPASRTNVLRTGQRSGMASGTAESAP